ncbi:hypothetical protein Tco_1394200 [Tanacetum coccineum]
MRRIDRLEDMILTTKVRTERVVGVAIVISDSYRVTSESQSQSQVQNTLFEEVSGVGVAEGCSRVVEAPRSRNSQSSNMNHKKSIRKNIDKSKGSTIIDFEYNFMSHFDLGLEAKRNIMPRIKPLDPNGDVFNLTNGMMPRWTSEVESVKYEVRCHGYPLDDERGNKLVKSTSCPVTGNELAVLDLIRNSLKARQFQAIMSFIFMVATETIRFHSALLLAVKFSIFSTCLRSWSQDLLKREPCFKKLISVSGKSGVEEMQSLVIQLSTDEIQASHIGNMSNGSKSRIAYLNRMVFIADLLDMVEGAEVDYSMVFIFRQLMFVDNRLAAGMGLCAVLCSEKAQSAGVPVHGKWVIGGKWVLLAMFQKVFPSKVVADKDDEKLVLVFDEALGLMNI